MKITLTKQEITILKNLSYQRAFSIKTVRAMVTEAINTLEKRHLNNHLINRLRKIEKVKHKGKAVYVHKGIENTVYYEGTVDRSAFPGKILFRSYIGNVLGLFTLDGKIDNFDKERSLYGVKEPA